MAKYRYDSHIAPALPDIAYSYSYRFISKAGDYLTLWLSNTPFVYAQYAGFPTYSSGICLPYSAPIPIGYCYHIGVDYKWWKTQITRNQYGGLDEEEREWIHCIAWPFWSNVNIYTEKGNVYLEGSAPKLYCPDAPIVEAFYNVFDEGSTISAGVHGSLLTVPRIINEMSKYLYGRTHNYLRASSPDGATVMAQLYCNGRLVASPSGPGSLQYWYKVPYTTVGKYQFHAVVSCTMEGAEAPSSSVSTTPILVQVIEYDINDYDPTTETDTTGQITPGSVITTERVDVGESTVDPSEDTYEDPISGEVDWGDDDDDGKIDITEDDPEPPIIVDDITQDIILKDGVGAMSYYLGYRIGKMLRGQMNGFDDVDAELINGVLYIRDAPAEQTETLLEVT